MVPLGLLVEGVRCDGPDGAEGRGEMRIAGVKVDCYFCFFSGEWG